ncbi:MAG: aminotransferase class I/II-fold pyridoxal phosphate-dependent enzyme [Lachnospiraceae bacterium]|nr:aminotransferase class I/II-fold pyridoxal phosphate-dependent enzyme [Lachnospiraceae bacterium]
MNYNFTKLIDRRGKDATAVDSIGKIKWGFEPKGAKPGFDEIPMWVADMNFETAPSIVRAIEERLQHPLFGYFSASDAYYESIIDWQKKHYGYTDLTADMIGYENGVHGGITSTINTVTQPGDAVFLHSPTYVGFMEDLEHTGRRPILSPIVKDSEGVWRMDFDDMERKLSESGAHLAIFCSPHNPTGRVWERWEIEKAMELFKKHDCVVISDEIWSDLIMPGYTHIPTITVSKDAASRTVALYAPSKTFNLAGLIGSYHIIKNPLLREKVTRFGVYTAYNEMNVLSMHALIGAYKPEGEVWLSELLAVLESNCRYATDFINNNLKGCHASMPQGTYMVFMDCRDYMKESGKTLDQIMEAGWDVGVAYQDGRHFNDDGSIRINVALPHSRVVEAFDRLAKYVFV